MATLRDALEAGIKAASPQAPLIDWYFGDDRHHNGTLTLDVSQLPRGIYAVMIEHDGQMIPAGKIALIGK